MFQIYCRKLRKFKKKENMKEDRKKTVFSLSFLVVFAFCGEVSKTLRLLPKRLPNNLANLVFFKYSFLEVSQKSQTPLVATETDFG